MTALWWALLVVSALGGFYCLLRWTTSAPTSSAGRHRAPGGGDRAGRRALIAEQKRAGDAAQARLRAAVARETGGRG